MRRTGFLPSYDDVFGLAELRSSDPSRSVYSPAAYLVDLVNLLEDSFADLPLSRRRPDIREIPLDAAHADAPMPYLDIVIKVLTRAVGPDVDTVLRATRSRVDLPFDRPLQRLATGLQQLGVRPESLYRDFVREPDPDVLAAEYLGLGPTDLAAVLDAGLDTLPGGDLNAVDEFLRRTAITEDELHEVLFQQLSSTAVTAADPLSPRSEQELAAAFFVNQGAVPVITTDDGLRLRQAGSQADAPPPWFDRALRFVRLARRVRMSPTDLDLVLRACCSNRIDAAALRTIAGVAWLTDRLDQPVDVVCSLLAPMSTVGVGDAVLPADLFDRVFNAPFADVERTVLAGPAFFPPRYHDYQQLHCAGDLLALDNKPLRLRICRALAITTADLTTIVTRYRERSAARGAGAAGGGGAGGPSLFDRDPLGLEALSLLHRVAVLSRALGIGVGGLLAVLDALEADPVVRARVAVPLPVPVPMSPGGDPYQVLAAGDPTSALWLVQTVAAVAGWMQDDGLAGDELNQILGGPTGRPAAVVDTAAALREQFVPVAFGPDTFTSQRFGARSARVIHDVLAIHPGIVSARDPRVLRLDPDRSAGAALAAIAALATFGPQDLIGLGLADRLVQKIYTGLLAGGYLTAGGGLVDDQLPATPDGLVLARDFSARRDAVFALIAGICAGDQPPGAAPGAPQEVSMVFPSDLADLSDLSEAQQAELYDHLIYLGHLEPDGAVVDPAFFLDAENVMNFSVTVDLGGVAPAVLDRIHAALAAFASTGLTLGATAFDGLDLTDDQVADLRQSLRFNGVIDAHDHYVDKAAVLHLGPDDLGIAAQFHARRRALVTALRADVERDRVGYTTFTAESFRDAAERHTAMELLDDLEGSWLQDRQVPGELWAAFLNNLDSTDDGALPATPRLRPADRAVIREQFAAILGELQPYRLDRRVLADLTFSDGEIAELEPVLVAEGWLTADLVVSADQLERLTDPDGAMGFLIGGVADYSKEIFALLHGMAVQTTAAVNEISAALAGSADRQAATLAAALQDLCQVPTETVAVLCRAVAGSAADALEILVPPALAATGAVPADAEFRLTLRRIVEFARLAAKLGLTPSGVAVGFADQDLAGKFPEPLALPPGLDRFDALLTDQDGSLLLFAGARCWTYAPSTRALVAPDGAPLRALSERFAVLAAVDAAFTTDDGAQWVVGRGEDGAAHVFVRAAGSTRWVARQQVWGRARNAFADPRRVDAAFVDRAGRAYLFCDDQYIRYSTADLTVVDEGYPRLARTWWAQEGGTSPLPGPFGAHIDAGLVGRDGRTHLFSGGATLCVENGAGPRPVEEVWGRVRNVFAGANRIDAGFTVEGVPVMLRDDQLVAYPDALENPGLRVAEGYPLRIRTRFPTVPAGFESGVQAGLVDGDGVVHLFKAGQVATLSSDGVGVAPTSERWGVLAEPLLDGRVDAAFVGLDGRTYLFSGTRYVRYSGSDYTRVDLGYPRSIAGDWGGLQAVGAAFVLDGATYVFGQAPGASGQSYVRYSTRDYRVPDAGYPRQASDNWWNLPAAVVDDATAFPAVDAVLSGPDGRTYLFSGDAFVVFDAKRRWWSPPQQLAQLWPSLPFDAVDAAFVGIDANTYVFRGDRYARLSAGDRTHLDDRFPAPTRSFWGRVDNAIALTGQVDAALVLDVDEPVEGGTRTRTYTYLFSGNQYVRYADHDYSRVEDGYPRALASLVEEPRFANLHADLSGGVDAAFADRHTIVLVSGPTCHLVTDSLYRRRTDLPVSGLRAAFIEDGTVLVEDAQGWRRSSNLDGTVVETAAARPQALRGLPEEFRTGLDAVLVGVDDNTYVFKGTEVFDVELHSATPLAQDWGRPRNNVYHAGVVDAAFVGVDKRTYVFSGDQFIVYAGNGYLDTEIVGEPQLIAEHWAGLRSVGLAYVRDGVTYLYEKPDATGNRLLAVYSSSDYTRPDADPMTVDAGFLDIPPEIAADGFGEVAAVLFQGENMLVLSGDQFLQHHEPTDVWHPPRPLTRVWHPVGDTPDFDGLRTAFTGLDGATYFFVGHQFTRHDQSGFSPMRPVRDAWGHAHNNFIGADRRGSVDAAFVHRGHTTYLFSGDQYVRYSGSDYRYTDPGYPKAVIGELRHEAPFTGLPESFDDILADRAASGSGSLLDAVVSTGRTVFVFVGDECHIASVAAEATVELAVLGRVRNTIAEEGTVDAALRTDTAAFLFSGDQYVRYSGHDHTAVDEGYPRTIENGLAADLELAATPDLVRDGIDAALRGADGGIYLFRDSQFVRADTNPAAAAPVRDHWGRVSNAFLPDGDTTGQNAVDAAFVDAEGGLYIFKAEQFARYRPGQLDDIEEGFPRTLRPGWGQLPAAFAEGIDAAFVLDGRTYLVAGDHYVRYSGSDHEQVDRLFPQSIAQRWADTADYRLEDVVTISRFARLPAAAQLAELLAAAAAVPDPYQDLSDLQGWDPDELRWLKRQAGFLPGASPDEERFEIEFLLRAADVFTLANTARTGPTRLYTDIWSRRWANQSEAEGAVGVAADVLDELLLGGRSEPDRDQAARALHDARVVPLRDALVSALIAADDALDGPDDLFERYLVDVQMGTQGTTSPVREAIGAVQLYVGRYLTGLESPQVADGLPGADIRARIKSYWSWMRSYQLWVANRKVFLYPENYVRPELRAGKTPAFKALETDLQQADISADAVQKAFRHYLDEYTEVSRLTIAGGQVYAGTDPEAGRTLVLFGRTKTDPRRYYFRQAEFLTADGLSATWSPWAKVDVRINADKVYPVHAFDRVFVFWAEVEANVAATATTTVPPRSMDGSQTVAASGATHRIKIFFSYINLAGDWVAAQLLGTGDDHAGQIGRVDLFAQRSEPDADHPERPTSIVIGCSYPVDGEPTYVQFVLTPDLTATRGPGAAFDSGGADLFALLFDEDPIDEADVVLFNSVTDAVDAPWFAFDHKGGSFLARPTTVPVIPALEQLPVTRPAPGRALPPWDRINAGFPNTDGSATWFDNGQGRYAVVDATGAVTEEGPTAQRWGRVSNALTETGIVDAGLERNGAAYLFSGPQYVRISGADLSTADPGYPRRIADNTDGLPRWNRVDAAFRGLDGVEYYFSGELSGVVSSADLTDVRPTFERWGRRSSDDAQGTPFGSEAIEAALVRGPHTFLISGGEYIRYTGPSYGIVDEGYPRPLDHNPDDLPAEVTAAAGLRGASYFFQDEPPVFVVVEPDGATWSGQTKELGAGPISAIQRTSAVNAAWVVDGWLYLATGTEYVRYTRDPDGGLPQFVDEGYPRASTYAIDGVFAHDDVRYAFIGDRYGVLAAGAEPDTLVELRPIRNNWANLPVPVNTGVTGAADLSAALYLFRNATVVEYRTERGSGPYERSAAAYEIVRLTTATASTLNRRLLAGGVAGLLDTVTQETDETPAFAIDRSDQNTIRYRPRRISADRLPAESHLDFDSANGIYYWEIFFHAPLLIAQTLADAQKFDAALTWYAYVFDPADPERYWHFLPFLGLDLQALLAACRTRLAELAAAQVDLTGLADLPRLLDELDPLVPLYAQLRAGTAADVTVLAGVTTDRLRALDTGLAALRLETTPAAAAGRDQLREATALLGGLRRGYELLGDRRSLVRAYLDDPFDPHAIAALRPVAYRRAVVMRYIDTVLKWGDMLFGQYTPESVDEARMLYVLAADLLGRKPGISSLRALPPVRTVAELDPDPGTQTYNAELVEALTGDGELLTGAGAVHAGVASPYFVVPPNEAFLDCWNQVEDRLLKIRESLTITGAAAPLPLFGPAIDPAALVAAATAGGLGAAVEAAAPVPVPNQRFVVVLRRAQDLLDRLRFLGNDLLNALDRHDGEQLSLLLTHQEGVILGMTRAIREAEIRAAAEAEAELATASAGAQKRLQHFQGLIDTGRIVFEGLQLGMMADAGAANIVAATLKIGSAIAYVFPEFLIGPFIAGVEEGSQEFGHALDKGADAAMLTGQAFSSVGEIFGLQAAFERTQQDWSLQRTIAQTELDQIGHQLAAARERLSIAQRDLAVLDQQIVHNATVATFMTTKFTSIELYSWLADRLGSIYFQTFALAQQAARAAERAFQFERGLAEGDVSFVRGSYWDDRRHGLLAAEALALDLDRMAAAYADRDVRGLEIARQVSLLQLDPLALLRLKRTGVAEFALPETLFDRDFPGHYRRQLRTFAVSFDGLSGRLPVNAVLTQLSHTTVLEPDPKAVTHLLDPQSAVPPSTLRSDWRPGQQVALSYAPDYQDNNGLFELRYDDDRYLPFEGTGAVSRWRLEVPGVRTSAGMDQVRDVTLTVRYTALAGDPIFAAAVAGALRPRAAARLFDIAEDFPDQWSQFQEGDSRELVLPVTPDMLPGIIGSQITTVYAEYRPPGTTRFLVEGDPEFALRDAVAVATPGLNAGPAGIRLVLDGARPVLDDLMLVLTYRSQS